MEAVRLYKVVEKDGEIVMKDLPCKKGQHVEMILLMESPAISQTVLTAKNLLHSGLIGIWKDREDIGNSVTYARKLREQGQRRELKL